MAKPTAKKYTTKAGNGYWRGIYHCDGNCMSGVLYGHCRGHSDGLSGFKLKGEAIKAAAKRQEEVRSNGYHLPEDKNVSLDYIAQEWFRSGRDVTDSTIGWNKGMYHSYIEADFGSTPLWKITRFSIKQWTLRLRDEGKAKSTMHGGLTVLRQILEYAVDPMERLPKNPAAGIQVPKPQDKAKIIKPFSEDEIWLVADHIRDISRFLILVCAYCGLRFGEAAGLHEGDITWSKENGSFILNVNRQYGKGKYSDPKWNSFREIPITPRLWTELERHMAQFPPDENPDNLVFVNTRGTHLYYRSFLEHFHAILNEVGLERRGTHALRHTFVKLCKKRGVNPWLIKEMAGHKSISVTMDIYGIDTDTEDLVKATRLLSENHRVLESATTLSNSPEAVFAATIAATLGFDTDGTSPGFGGISN